MVRSEHERWNKIHVRQRGGRAQHRGHPDEAGPAVVQRGGPERHLPLQEQRGVQGRTEREPEEGSGPQGLQRPGHQSAGQQPPPIHGPGGRVLGIKQCLGQDSN